MIEKRSPYTNYQKKIVPYLDGSLSRDEASEFEAFVLTHPEFEIQIKSKQQEIQLIKSLIPVAVPSKESTESIHIEMRSSIFNLLKEEPRGLWDSFRIGWDSWINR